MELGPIHGILACLTIYIYTRKSYTIWRSDTKKYLTRWYLVGPWFRWIFNCRPYLHHFWASDDKEFHSHRWKKSWSLVLWGGYREQRKTPLPTGVSVGRFADGKIIMQSEWFDDSQVLRPLSLNRLDSDCFHRVDLLNERRGAWTLFLAGPHDETKPDWGFLRDDGSIEYAYERFDGKRDSLSND